jgi:hypothetical protein
MFLLLAARLWRMVFIVVTVVVLYRCAVVLKDLRMATVALFVHMMSAGVRITPC